MKNLFYPAIFHEAEEGGFWVTFPDIPECLTQGENMDEAYEMAVDALGLALSPYFQSHEMLPVPSVPSSITTDDGFLVVIEFNLEAYRKRHNSKAVKKTLTIPQWLNEEAMALGINFSQVLQEALITKINLSRPLL